MGEFPSPAHWPAERSQPGYGNLAVIYPVKRGYTLGLVPDIFPVTQFTQFPTFSRLRFWQLRTDPYAFSQVRAYVRP